MRIRGSARLNEITADPQHPEGIELVRQHKLHSGIDPQRRLALTDDVDGSDRNFDSGIEEGDTTHAFGDANELSTDVKLVHP